MQPAAPHCQLLTEPLMGGIWEVLSLLLLVEVDSRGMLATPCKIQMWTCQASTIYLSAHDTLLTYSL